MRLHRLFCWIGLHVWSEWKYRECEQYTWKARTCSCCDHTQTEMLA